MKIQTRRQLTEEIARRIYEDFRILDVEDSTNSDRNWQMAESIVAFNLDGATGEYNWVRQCRVEDYQKYNMFIRNYEDNRHD